MSKSYTAINLAEKFSLFNELWQPKVIAEMNDYQFKLVKIEGEFVWHSHADTDETFILIDGELDIALRDGVVSLKPGEMYVVPKTIEHKPIALTPCQVLLIEPRGVANTGDQGGERTAELDVWI